MSANRNTADTEAFVNVAAMLASLDLFEGVNEEELSAVAAHGTVRRYPKNTIIVMEGDIQSRLFVVLSGRVRVYAHGDGAKQLTLRHLGPGTYFGELSLIDEQPRSASVGTVEATELLAIDGRVFKRVLARQPTLAEALLKHLAMTVRGLTDNVTDIALLDVYGRVIRVLERFCQCDESTPRLTHQEIASMVGASREMVSRVLRELVRGEYIQQSNGRITVHRTLPRHW